MAFTESEEATLRGIIKIHQSQSAAYSDDLALIAPGLYPEWSGDGVAYTSGERLMHGGTLYSVLQDHTSQPDWAPDVATGLFTAVLVESDGQVVAWVAPPPGSSGYKKGQRVIHNGKLWESLVDNNTWEPGAAGTETVWVEVAE